MFPDFALQALDEVVPNSLANGFRRIVPASAGAALRFVPLQPLKEWDYGVEIYARCAVAGAPHCLRSKDGQREMQVIPEVEHHYAMLGSTPTCNDLVAQLHSALPGPARDVPLKTFWIAYVLCLDGTHEKALRPKPTGFRKKHMRW